MYCVWQAVQDLTIPAVNVSKLGIAHAGHILTSLQILAQIRRAADDLEYLCIAVPCSSASSRSRVSRATSASWPEAEERRMAFGALRSFSVTVFARRALTGSLERLLHRLPRPDEHRGRSKVHAGSALFVFSD